MEQSSKVNRLGATAVERYGRLREMDRSFDIAYWQSQGCAAILEAAWQMVVETHSRIQGRIDEPRLRRSVETFQRFRR